MLAALPYAAPGALPRDPAVLWMRVRDVSPLEPGEGPARGLRRAAS